MITRRLYLIASLQSVDLPNKAARRWDSIIEWTLGLIIPLLIAGPIYYAHQGCRFVVDEAFGCTNAVRTSILEILTVDSWTVLLPLVSILFFYPRVVHTFYRQSRDINSFLNSDTSVLRTNYLRILVVASIDILLTLPMGTVSIVLRVRSILEQKGSLAFYLGWTCIHINWKPSSTPYAQLKASGIAGIAQLYFFRWSAPVLAFTIFGLFGLTSEARASYGLIVRAVGSWIRWAPTTCALDRPPSVGEMEFAERSQNTSLRDVEMGSCSMSAVGPSTGQDVKHALDRIAKRSDKTGLESTVKEGQSASSKPKIERHATVAGPSAYAARDVKY